MDFKNHKNITVVLGLAFLLRIILSFFGTLNLDQGTFIAWSSSLFNEGFKNFYNGWSDYLPGYPFVLWLLGAINTYHILPEGLLYKIPANIADILTGILIYKILKKSKGEKWGLIGASIYVFNPAIIFNSALWGQVDSLTALTSVLAIYLLPRNYYLSAASLSFGTLVKPQTAFVLPVILMMMLKNKMPLKKIFTYMAIGILVFVGLFIPYWNHSSLISFILERLGVSLNQYPYTSVNAFNFWGLGGFWKADSIYSQIGGYLAVISMLLITFISVNRENKNQKNLEYMLSALIFASTFIFFTRMHERHLLPLFAPLAIALVENPVLIVPYLGFSLTYIANLYYAYVWISDSFKEVFSESVVKLFEIINIGLVVYILVVLNKGITTSWKSIKDFIGSFKFIKGKKPVEYKLPKTALTSKKAKIILCTILLFAFVTRIFDLGSPKEMYFDEVYHAFTAKIIISPEVSKAWEWWNTPPEGFAYEWTHPPFAKLGMAAGMMVFGQNAFGWRIPGALLGVGAVYLVYLLAKKIFNDEATGLTSAAVFSLDGLALVMSRIGMNDSYILFFALLSLYLYLINKNFLSALVFGFSIASKWSAIWAVPIFGIIFLSQKKKLNLSYLWFLLLPFSIYLLSYFDMFLTKHDLSTWWGMQQQMWWYHTGLRAEHPYTSQWWTWPLLLRPIYLYTSDEIGGMVARIYAFGNPIVFWFGLTSVILSVAYAIKERNKKLGLVVFSYLIFFVPWALSPRIMFLYHYLPSVPFMAIASGYILRRNPKLTLYFLVTASLAFIYFYPHWAGLQIPLWLDKSYYWFNSWR